MDLEGRVYKVLAQHLPVGGTEENHYNPRLPVWEPKIELGASQI
jgi:hypothetical protein